MLQLSEKKHLKSIGWHPYINVLQWDLEIFSLEKSIVKISQSRLFVPYDLSLWIYFIEFYSFSFKSVTQKSFLFSFSQRHFVCLLCKLYLSSWEKVNLEGTCSSFALKWRWRTNIQYSKDNVFHRIFFFFLIFKWMHIRQKIYEAIPVECVWQSLLL